MTRLTRRRAEVQERSGLAFRLLICDTCRAVWPTERDEAHGGSRSDGEPCAYAYGGRVCRGTVHPMHDHRPHERFELPKGAWVEGSGRWRKELGLPASATLAQVRARYRQLAREHHPDVGGSHERMLAINRAYAEALSELAQPGT